MDHSEAVARVLQGEALRSIAGAYRDDLITAMGLQDDDITDNTFKGETSRFMKQLCRHLGDRYEGDQRVGVALLDWVHQVDDYEAYDALLTSFQFETRPSVVRKGRILFPGPLTAHWES